MYRERLAFTTLFKTPGSSIHLLLSVICIQDEEASELGEMESEGCLLESWPDESAEGILASAMRAVAPEGHSQHFADGESIAKQGDPFLGVYMIEQGQVEVESIEDVNSDEEDEEVRP